MSATPRWVQSGQGAAKTGPCSESEGEESSFFGVLTTPFVWLTVSI